MNTMTYDVIQDTQLCCVRVCSHVLVRGTAQLTRTGVVRCEKTVKRSGVLA